MDRYRVEYQAGDNVMVRTITASDFVVDEQGGVMFSDDIGRVFCYFGEVYSVEIIPRRGNNLVATIKSGGKDV